jgi:hypothetical protein
MHPDIEWRTLDAFPDAGTYRGREEVREFWRAWRDTFRGIVEREPRAELGRVTRCLSTRRDRDGRVIWVGMFSSESDALEAAELEE